MTNKLNFMDEPARRLLLSVVVVVLSLLVTNDASAQTQPQSNPSNTAKSIQSTVQESIQLIDQTRSSQDLPNTQGMDRQQRIRSIQDRIQLLKKLMQEKSNQPGNANLPSAVRANPTEIQQQSKNYQLQNLTPSGQPKDETQETEAGNQEQSDPSTEPQQEEFPVEMTTPINVTELAHSLFLSGNFADALNKYKSFQETDAIQFSSDPWAKTMMANCYRLTGDLGNAEAYYRELAALKDESYPEVTAKWYLSHLTKRKQLKTDFESLINEADSIVSPQKRGNQ